MASSSCKIGRSRRNDEASNSPYYKGLTDQSLAIVDNNMPNPMCPDDDDDHPLSLIPPSPYYKGLTDYSLVITHHPNHPMNITATTNYESSPYYRGLINYSLALCDKINTIIASSPPHKINTHDFTLKDLMLAADHVAFLIEPEKALREKTLDPEEMGLQEKPLRERVSETSHEEGHKTVLDHVSEQTHASGDHVYQYTWAAKYQPKTLEEFICNRDTALQLKALVKEGCGCDHFIFEGPASVGKRSMIRAMLREVFGADRVQVVEECKEFNLKGEMIDNLQVKVKKSLHHVEVNLSETKGYEKHVIVDLFKETYGKIIDNSQPCNPENCQAIILYEAEKLSIESLLYIKWLLEKYKGCNKVFFCCSDESRLQPVKSLCTTLRLSSPTTEEIVKILEYIGKEEGIELSRDIVKKIISRSKNNLRQAIRSLEASCRNRDALNDEHLILTGWEDDIMDIAKKITQEQSPRQLYVIRRMLQSLMIHVVPPDFVYKSLVAELTNLVDESLRSGVAKLDKEFNRASEIKFETMKQFGHSENKQADSHQKNPDPSKKNAWTYLRVEEFIAKFMSWYKHSSGNCAGT